MKKIGLSLIALLFAVVLLGQRTFNDPNAEVRNVSNFKGVRVATGIQLVLTQGETEAVAISAGSEEAKGRVVTEVEDGVLKIYIETKGLVLNFKKFKKPVKAWVSIKTVEKLAVSSGARMEIEGTVKADVLDLKVTSGSEFKGKIDVSLLNIDQGSGSDAWISGVAQKITASAGSGSELHAYDLITEKADVKVNSGASVQLTVNKEINATAGSGGEVSYKGNAEKRDVRTNSGGSVTHSK